MFFLSLTYLPPLGKEIYMIGPLMAYFAIKSTDA